MSVFQDDFFAQDPLAAIIADKTIQLKEGERRTVSILFADLKGFTEMSEKLDPEFVQTTIDKIMSVFTQDIKNHGGYVDKYSGDEVMALFGAKVASEVDTERAIRAGLQMLSSLEKFNEYMKTKNEYSKIEKDLAIRIGINTGLVTTGKIGEGREGDFTVYGDAVNLASRLESNAPVNSILVPESIEKMLPDQFNYSDMGNIQVKGKTNTISVFTVNDIKKTSSAFSIQYKTAFIGRADDLKYLISLYKDVTLNIGREKCVSSLIGIRAEAGIGKTRLIHEFLNEILPKGISPNYVIIGRTTNLTRQPYSIFISLLRFYFQLSEVDGLIAVQKRVESKYEELKENLNSSEQTQLNTTKSIIGFLLGIPSKDIRLQAAGKNIQTDIHIALYQFFQLITLRCNQSSIPFVFVLEDLHWIDDLSMEALHFLIQQFTERDNKAGLTNLFVFDYRQTFEFPEEMKLKEHFNELNLSPLSDDHSKEMIMQAFHLDVLPEHEINNILQITGGNPFYIEEWIAYINNYQMKHDQSVEEIIKKSPPPTSLNSLILSRIDTLDKLSKSVLQSAAIMGMDFYGSILQSLQEKLQTGIKISDVLDALIEKDLIYKGSIDQYSFKHILARDVIYEAILKSNRKMLHREIGYILEDNFTENKNLFYYDLAEHFDKADEFEKAVIYLEQAGKKAQELFDNINAVEFYQKLVNILKNTDYSGNIINLQDNKWKTENVDDSETLEAFVRYQSALCDILSLLGKWDDAQSVIEDTLIAAKEHKDPLYYPGCVCRLGEVYRLKSNFKESRKWLVKSKTLCQKHTKGERYIDVLSLILDRLGKLDIDEGKLESAEKIFKEKEVLIRNLDQPMDNLALKGDFGVLYLKQNKLDQAYTEFESMYKLCQEHGLKNLSIQALNNMGVINNIQGNISEAGKIYTELIEVTAEIGDRRANSQGYGNLGIVHMFMHEYEMAIQHFNTQLVISEKMNDWLSMMNANNNISYTYLLSGNYKNAVKHAKKSLEINAEIGSPDPKAQACDTLGLAYIQLGEFKNAKEYYDKALEIFLDIENKHGVAEVEGGLGIISMENKKYEDAEKYFTSALKVFEDAKDQRLMAEYYLKRAVLYHTKGQFDMALGDINKAEKYSKAINDDSLIFQSSLHKLLNEFVIEKISQSKAVKSIETLYQKSLKMEDQALYYYHLWKIGNIDQNKEKSLSIYKDLDKEKPSYFFKKHISALHIK